MMCNGLSSSPSNSDAPFSGADFPKITHWDNVHAQQKMLEQEYGVESLALVTGFSMGGQQANHWAAIFPDRVERMISWCGSAATAPHNWVFLEGVRLAFWLIPCLPAAHTQLFPRRVSAPLPGFGLAGGLHRLFTDINCISNWARKRLLIICRSFGSQTFWPLMQMIFWG